MPKDELTPWSKLKLATVVSLGGSYTSLSNNIAEDSPKLSKTPLKSSMPVNLNSNTKVDDPPIPISAEFKASSLISRDDHKTSVSDSELKSDSSTVVVKRKPKPFKLNEPKNYRSVDDLSPEYSGLPFVKKLKILNERQKLAELESVIQTTRSLSLDCTDSSNSSEMVEILTRSHSEASCMIRPKLNATTLCSPIASVAPFPNSHHHVKTTHPLSPESNETLERKQLKSILKKLSEDRLSQNIATLKVGDRQDMKRLMRAQTVEGYVARRTKFTKSVTFNHTLSSPPSTTTLTEEPEESLKLSPINTQSYPPVFSPSPNQSQKSILTQSNAQDLSTSSTTTDINSCHHEPHNITINNVSDASTNRFNYSDESTTLIVQPPPTSDEPTTVDNHRPISQHQQQQQEFLNYNNNSNHSIENVDNNMNNNNTNTSNVGTLAFLSDSYSERKLIKGIL